MITIANKKILIFRLTLMIHNNIKMISTKKLATSKKDRFKTGFKIAVNPGFCFYGFKKMKLKWLLGHSKLKPPVINRRKKIVKM